MITACKFCHFALYDKDTQIGCRLGKLDKFREQGYDIIEAYDEEKEFYIIKAFCPFFRTDEWASSKIDPVKSVTDETKINYHIIVKYEPESFEVINHAFRNQTIKPNTFSILTDKLLDGKKFDLRFNNWKISQIMNDDWRAGLDSLVSTVDDQLYIYIDSLQGINPYDLGSRLNKWIVDELKPFLAAVHGKSYICVKSIHSEFGGNLEKPLLEKLKDKGLEKQILNINDL